jgi:ppGpp synthetase/RelA/SpoT-type nucleotidyltranferase
MGKVTTEDQKWAREQIGQYEAMVERYKSYAKTLQSVLEKAAKKHAPLAIVQSRPKSIASFAEKILRKRDNYADPVNQFTDLCGARVITHTTGDVKAMCEFIEDHFDVDWENSIDVSQRLEPTEFGYRSIHYIVSFKRDPFPAGNFEVQIPDDVFDLKAEIQVRTLLEHTWADFAHDISYKSAFKIPRRWERELAAFAALVESADQSLVRIKEGLQRYAASYGSYMSREEIRDEIFMLETVLEQDPGNAEIAARIGKLAMVIEDWDKAISVLRKCSESGYPPALRDLGVAMCKLHRQRAQSSEYKQGQQYLETACQRDGKDLDAIASLAGTWKGVDDEKARKLYRQAFELDPTDPYALGNALEYEISARQDAALSSLMRPLIKAAMRRCREQADVGMNLPWAYFDMGKFLLLLGKPEESLAAYAKAVQLSTAKWMIETSLHSLEKLRASDQDQRGFAWARRLLALGWTVKLPASARPSKIEEFAFPKGRRLEVPVVILAGGCDGNADPGVRRHGHLLREAFRSYRGTLICCGGSSAAGLLAAELRREYASTVRILDYAAQTGGAQSGGLGPEAPLQYWADLIASGIEPSQVKVLGIEAAAITALELRIALALGASAAVLQESGNGPPTLAFGDGWNDSEKLLYLPADAMIARAYLDPGIPKVDSQTREKLAQAVHNHDRRTRLATTQSEDLSLAEWDELEENLKESNRQQADHIAEKVQRLGCTLHVVAGREPSPMTFTDAEIDLMAAMEHGRWTAERLLGGWAWGPEKDVIKKISPYLVAWSDLPQDVRERDRDTVRKIPQFLAGVGLEVRRHE